MLTYLKVETKHKVTDYYCYCKLGLSQDHFHCSSVYKSVPLRSSVCYKKSLTGSFCPPASSGPIYLPNIIMAPETKSIKSTVASHDIAAQCLPAVYFSLRCRSGSDCCLTLCMVNWLLMTDWHLMRFRQLIAAKHSLHYDQAVCFHIMKIIYWHYRPGKVYFYSAGKIRMSQFVQSQIYLKVAPIRRQKSKTKDCTSSSAGQSPSSELHANISTITRWLSKCKHRRCEKGLFSQRRKCTRDMSPPTCRWKVWCRFFSSLNIFILSQHDSQLSRKQRKEKSLWFTNKSCFIAQESKRK